VQLESFFSEAPKLSIPFVAEGTGCGTLEIDANLTMKGRTHRLERLPSPHPEGPRRRAISRKATVVDAYLLASCSPTTSHDPVTLTGRYKDESGS
jgi:hypothetical protein